MELVEFLRARLDEDEAVAKEAKPGPWTYDGSVYATHPVDEVVDYSYESGEHIARHDPARVLREVEAKRLRLDEIERELADDPTNETTRWLSRVEALPYADHPEYRNEWKP